MSSKISVFVKEPFKDPRHVNISNTLENFQRTVGGFIEYIPLDTNYGLIVNEEGLFRDFKFNARIGGKHIFGTAIFVGVKDEEFCDIPMNWDYFKHRYNYLFDSFYEEE